MTIDEVNKIIRENHLTSVLALKQTSRDAYNYVKSNRLQDKVTWPFGHNSTPGAVTPKMLSDAKQTAHYPIRPVLGYLQRWAEQDGTSVRFQAYKMGYGIQFDELFDDDTQS